MRSIFPLSQCQRNVILLFLRYKTLCKTRKNTCEFHLYCWDHVCKVNKWCFVDCFVDFCIGKCKTFSTCGRLLMCLQVIFFVIQNIYVNLNHSLLSVNQNFCLKFCKTIPEHKKVHLQP